MKSPIVVTSWWSNCLGLTCLSNLVQFAPDRDIYVMQAGKSAQQMDLFREFIPYNVTELYYPQALAADDSRMREYLALTVFQKYDGVWFVDHDTFFHENCIPWLDYVDHMYSQMNICASFGVPCEGGGITAPAYWLSPNRWPLELSSFDPIPFQEKPSSRRPDLFTHDGNLKMPEKDTLVQVRDELEKQDLAGTFPLTSAMELNHNLPKFPMHTHLGGIHLYNNTQPPQNLPSEFYTWMKETIIIFADFFANCPSEWLAIEEPELMRRHYRFYEMTIGLEK